MEHLAWPPGKGSPCRGVHIETSYLFGARPKARKFGTPVPKQDNYIGFPILRGLEPLLGAYPAFR